MTRLVAEILKNGRERVRVSLDSYRGIELVDVRVFCPRGDDGEMGPTKAGVALRVALLPELHAAIGKAIEAARADGLLP